ncbi:MAG: hypothetical protein GX119_02855 [Syntrophomonadaceae bacterium]|jgi:hypothetical protein|nr:hypothetical protein [Syntrophomonadaceae bacterium]
MNKNPGAEKARDFLMKGRMIWAQEGESNLSLLLLRDIMVMDGCRLKLIKMGFCLWEVLLALMEDYWP